MRTAKVRQWSSVSLGHEVEDVAHALEGRGEDVEGHLVEPCGMPLLGELEPLGHGGDGHPVDVVRRRRRRRAPASVACRRTLWAAFPAGEKSSSSVLAPGHAEIGGVDRAELDDRVEVRLRDAVDVGLGARAGRLGGGGGVSHRSNVSQPVATRTTGIPGRRDVLVVIVVVAPSFFLPFLSSAPPP